MNYSLLFIFFVSFQQATAETPGNSGNKIDQCVNPINIANPSRSLDFIPKNDTSLMSDNNLDQDQWYTFGIGSRLPEQCVEKFHCGTFSPIWMKGKHPDAGRPGPITVDVCAENNNGGNCCGWTSLISVKWCQDADAQEYFVYKLTRTDINSHYCAEKTSVLTHITTASTITTTSPSATTFNLPSSPVSLIAILSSSSSPDVSITTKAMMTTQSRDPCNDAVNIYTSNRNPNTIPDRNNNFLSDDQLDPNQWYTFGIGNQIPEHCVEAFHCGTFAAIWMKGRHPNASHPGPIIVDVCAQYYYSECCGWSSSITVKRCQDISDQEYFVYKLHPTVKDFYYCAETPTETTKLTENDPCSANTDLFHVKRYSTYIDSDYEPLYCDSYAVTDGEWYRFSNSIISDHCVPQYHCGSYASLWVNSSLPTDDAPKLVDLCGNYKSCCSWKSQIYIKRCRDVNLSQRYYYVYQLKVPSKDMCFNSICIDDCPSGQKLVFGVCTNPSDEANKTDIIERTTEKSNRIDISSTESNSSTETISQVFGSHSTAEIITTVKPVAMSSAESKSMKAESTANSFDSSAEMVTGGNGNNYMETTAKLESKPGNKETSTFMPSSDPAGFFSVLSSPSSNTGGSFSVDSIGPTKMSAEENTNNDNEITTTIRTELKIKKSDPTEYSTFSTASLNDPSTNAVKIDSSDSTTEIGLLANSKTESVDFSSGSTSNSAGSQKRQTKMTTVN